MAIKLTDAFLRKLIREERAKLGMGDMKDVSDTKADELDADELGSDKALENPVDHMKALKIRENAFIDALVKLREAKKAKAKKAKKESQDKKKKAAAKKKKSVKMNESQLIEAIEQTRKKIQMLETKK